MVLRNKKGFTLIELLVVMAIIGILSSVILVLLSGPREKSRDARRVSDIKQLQNALDLYFTDNQKYPPWKDQAGGQDPFDVLIAGGYLPTAPRDPLTPEYYYYYAYTSLDINPANLCVGTQACVSYHLGADLETEEFKALLADSDISADMDGADDNDGCENDQVRYCYDIVP